jgi:hypothetical protein
MHGRGKPPDWLDEPATAVLRDLLSAPPSLDVAVFAAAIPDLNGLTLGIVEGSAARDLSPLDDDLDPDEPTEYGGGNWVPRSLTGPELLVLVADILQEAVAGTSAGWGQSRPPCLHYPHPARPGVVDGDAWWVCKQNGQQLYRIGQDDVPTRLMSSRIWARQTRRPEKHRARENRL